MNTLQKIKELGYDENRLKLDDATYCEDDDECTINFVYADKNPINDNDKNAIRQLIFDDLNDVCNVNVKFNKSCFDADVIRKRFDENFEQKYKALSLVFAKDNVEIIEENGNANIIFHCDPMTKQVLENKGFVGELNGFLKHKFFYDFSINLVEKESSTALEELLNKEVNVDTGLSECLQEEEKLNKYLVNTGLCIYGKYAGGEPTFINKISNDDGTPVLLAGYVENPVISTFTRKSKMAGAEPEERKRFTFTLRDLSGKVDVVIFPNEKQLPDLEKITEGMQLTVGGTVSIFNERMNIKASSLSLCDIETKEIVHVYRRVNPQYYFVTPQPVNEVQQIDLFSMNQKQTDYWEKHDTVVVFDLETTGLDARSCQIIEIGAVKIQKGSIIETFQTLINPEMPIPREITEITHIDDGMVANAPTLEQVLPDFYRFTYGAVLSAYNIDFDYQFLDISGKKLRLLFNNEQIDTLRLARNKVPSLSNYKLGTVVKALNITLENAHRALADAYATAKVFIKLI